MGDNDKALVHHEGMRERVLAAIRLLYPDEMTPTAKRMLESICEGVSDD